MRFLKLVTMVSAIFLVVSWHGTQSAVAQSTNPLTNNELSKQDAIYRGISGDLYVTNRTLENYLGTLHESLEEALALLGEKDRWLDIGAGEGHAILDYYTAKYDESRMKFPARTIGKAYAVALSIEDRRMARWHTSAATAAKGRILYLAGRPFRDISAQELGKYNVITDLLGGFSYTTNMDLYMERAMEILVPGGSLYTLLQDVHSNAGGNKPYYPNAPFLTELIDADGSEITVCAWLQRISCVQVTCRLRTEWNPPIEVYQVKKICPSVKVPSLQPLHFSAGTPPERRFRVK